MKSLDKLQESYEKELELAKKHKKRAEELKQKIDEQKALTLQRKMQELQLTVDEYEKFIAFVSSKDSVMAVLSPEEMEKAIGHSAETIREADGQSLHEEEEIGDEGN